MHEFYVSDIADKALFFGVSVTVLLIPILLIASFLYFWVGLTNSKLEVNDSALAFRTVFYSKTIDIDDIFLDKVRMLDGKDEKNIPSFRTNGISFSGINWGWFKLKNGRRALVFVTDKEDSILIPTNLNFDVIISTSEPEKLINTIAKKGDRNEIH